MAVGDSMLPPIVINILADARDVLTTLAKVKAELADFAKQHPEAHLSANDDLLKTNLATATGLLDAWAEKPVDKRIGLQWPKDIAGQAWLDTAAAAAAKQAAATWQKSADLAWPKHIAGQTWLDTNAVESAKKVAIAWDKSTDLKWPKTVAGQSWLDAAAATAAKNTAIAWDKSADLKWPKGIAGQSWLDAAAVESAKKSAAAWTASADLRWPKGVAGQSWLDAAAVASAKKTSALWNASMDLKWPKTVAGAAWLDAAAVAAGRNSTKAWLASEGANGKPSSAFWPTAGAAAGASGDKGGGGGLTGFLAGLLGGGGNGKLLAGLGLGTGWRGLPKFGTPLSLMGFGLESFLMHGAGILGATAGGLLGGGLLAGGALSTMAVGMGTDLAGIGQASGDIKTVYTDMQNLNHAIAVYGKNSYQAAQAQAQLNYDLSSFNPVAKQAVLNAANAAVQLRAMFDKYTGLAEKIGAQIIGQGIHVAMPFIPVIGKFAAQNMAIIKKQLQPIFHWIDQSATQSLKLPGLGKTTIGAGGLGIFTNLEQVFQKTLPTAVHAAGQAFEFFARTMDVAAQYTGGFVQKINTFFTRMNQPGPFARWATTVGHLIGLFHTLMGLLGAIIGVIAAVFKPAVGFGQQFLKTLTQILDQIKHWLNLKATQNVMHSLFNAHLEEIIRLIGGAIKDVLPIVESAATAFMRISTVVVRLVNAALHPLDKALKTLGGSKIVKELLGWGAAAFVALRALRMLMAVVAANPWVLAAVAIVALVVEIINHWNTIKKVTAEVWQWVYSHLRSVWNTIKSTAITIWDAIKSHLGIILPAIATIILGPIGGVAVLVATHWKAVQKITGEVWQWVYSHLKSVWNTIVGTAKTVWNTLTGFFIGLWDGIKALFGSIWQGIWSHLSSVWNTIKSTAQTIWNALKAFFHGTLGQIVLFILNPIAGLVNLLYQHWHTISTDAKTVWNALKSFFKAVPTAILSFFEHWTLVGFLLTHWKTIESDAKSVWGQVLAFIKSIPGKILGVFKDAGKLLFSVGQQIINGLWSGLQSVASKPIDFIKNITVGKHGILGMAKSLLHVFSPSTDFITIGQMVMKGLHTGMKGEEGLVLGTVTDNVTKMYQAANKMLPEFRNLGNDIAQAIAAGVQQGEAAMARSISSAVQVAVTQAVSNATQTAIAQSQSQITTAVRAGAGHVYK